MTSFNFLLFLSLSTFTISSAMAAAEAIPEKVRVRVALEPGQELSLGKQNSLYGRSVNVPNGTELEFALEPKRWVLGSILQAYGPNGDRFRFLVPKKRYMSPAASAGEIFKVGVPAKESGQDVGFSMTVRSQEIGEWQGIVKVACTIEKSCSGVQVGSYTSIGGGARVGVGYGESECDESSTYDAIVTFKRWQDLAEGELVAQDGKTVVARLTPLPSERDVTLSVLPVSRCGGTAPASASIGLKTLPTERQPAPAKAPAGGAEQPSDEGKAPGEVPAL